MTQTSVRWANVLFGVGLTVVVALAPIVFVVLSGVSAEAGETQVTGESKASSLLNGGVALPHSQALLLLVAGLAVAVLVLTTAFTTRAQRKSP